MQKEELVKIRSYIEENLRRTNVAGMPYIDLHDNKSAIMARQNNVVFGRRGSGKSTLLLEVVKSSLPNIEINIEDYKNITFPNIIIKILELIFEKLLHETKRHFSLNLVKIIKLVGKQKQILKDLSNLYEEEDNFNGDLVSKNQEEIATAASLAASVKLVKAAVSVSAKDSEESTYTRKIKFAKLEKIKKELIKYKRTLEKVSSFVYNSRAIYILLDDFYFISYDDQPYLADVIHVLSKGTNFFIKIASIKHRSKLYIKDEKTYHGIELGHDATEIDLDYSLEDFNILLQFYTHLLTEIFKSSKVNITIGDLFGGAGFQQLCIASGGVTRDFLVLLSRCLNDLIIDPEQKIGKESVNAQAAAYMVNKQQSLTQDIRRESDKLEAYLNFIKDEVMSKKRTNCFLIAKDDLEQHPNEKSAIRDLFDMRFIHLIDKNTSSAPSDGKQYEAYIIDVGLYDFTRLRKFNQIEPCNIADKSLKDAMRASPKIGLAQMKQSFQEKPV